MSEAELYLIKQRMLAGKRAKAERGELGMVLPRGYIRQTSGEVIKDPDEQVQSTIALVFNQFERVSSVNGLLQFLVRQHILLPHRVPGGLNKGDLQWSRPNRATLTDLLRNPIYAGAYVYGRRPTDPRRCIPGRPSTGRVVAKPLQWGILHKDRLPSYISWEQYERNLHQLEINSAQGMGAIRHGPSLLSGLLICGRCGLRMAALYRNNGHSLRYECNQMAVNYAQARCQSLVGRILDDFVTQQVLCALEPAALEISLRVAAEIEAERAQLHQHWQQRLERAHYEVERAARQYHCVEPEHRLVARNLEQQWEDALNTETALKADYERWSGEHPACLSAEQREEIRRLSADIPTLWHAPTTTIVDRQAIVRQLVERIVVTVQGSSERVDVRIQWAGGYATQAMLIRPIARLDQLSYYPQLTARVAELHAQNHEGAVIARLLNEEGWHPAKRCETFNGPMVGALMMRMGLRTRKKTPAAMVERQSDEWTLSELSHLLDLPPPTLYSWLRRGELQARQVMSQSHRLWLIHATTQNLERLRLRRNAESVKTIDHSPIEF